MLKDCQLQSYLIGVYLIVNSVVDVYREILDEYWAKNECKKEIQKLFSYEKRNKNNVKYMY